MHGEFEEALRLSSRPFYSIISIFLFILSLKVLCLFFASVCAPLPLLYPLLLSLCDCQFAQMLMYYTRVSVNIILGSIVCLIRLIVCVLKLQFTRVPIQLFEFGTRTMGWYKLRFFNYSIPPTTTFAWPSRL